MKKRVAALLGVAYTVSAAITLAYTGILVHGALDRWVYVQALRGADRERVVDTEILAADHYASAYHRPPNKRFTLLVVASGECDSCAPTWKTWLNALERANEDVDLVLAMPSGTLRVESSVAQSPQFVVLRIRDLRRFSAYTGIRMLPMSILIDDNNRVEAAISGIPSANAVRDALHVVQAVGPRSVSGTLWEHNSSVVSVAAPPGSTAVTY